MQTPVILRGMVDVNMNNFFIFIKKKKKNAKKKKIDF